MLPNAPAAAVRVSLLTSIINRFGECSPPIQFNLHSQYCLSLGWKILKFGFRLKFFTQSKLYKCINQYIYD